ncbi:MAG: amidohydrolase [Acidimicrobiia bacterium]
MSNVQVFHNGTIYTADRAGSWAEAVAIDGGRIRAVGTLDSILDAFPDVEMIDLGGRTMVPGFIDPHNHYLSTGESLASLDLRYPAIASVEDLVEIVAEAASETPPGRWIRGFGFDYAKFERAPTRWDLDRATVDHPVGLTHISGHYLLVNSHALNMAGITDDTPDPKGGCLVRDESGRVTGLCQDAAQAMVQPVAVDVGSHGINFHIEASLDELVDAVDRAGSAFVSAGLTTVADAQVSKREMAGYIEARRRGKWWVRTACMPLSHQLEDFKALGLAGPFGDDELWIGPMKFYMDGSMIGGTAVFSEPYGENGEFEGLLFWEPKELMDLVVDAHQQGWQIGIHAQGDRAIEAVLDAYEAAIEADPRPDRRHRIEHCGYPTPKQLERMAALGVIAVNQPNLLVDSGDEFLLRLGERAHWLQPMRAEIEAGVRFVLSSDSDVTSYRPLDSIAAAVQRTTLGGRQIGPEQTLTIEEAVRAHTIDAAFSILRDDSLGSIEPGKYADLTIIDGDPFAAKPAEVGELEIWKTLINGEVVYDRSLAGKTDEAT